MATRKKNDNPFAKYNLYLIGDTFHWRQQINGQQYNESTQSSDIRVAKEYAIERRAEVLRNEREGLKTMTVKKLIERAMEEKKGKAGYASGWVNYNRFEPVFKKDVNEVEKHELVACINAMRDAGRAVSTIALTIRYWNTLMNFAVENRVQPGPKLDTINDIPGNDRFLTEDEEARLLAALTPPPTTRQYISEDTLEEMHHNYDLVIALLDLGCRVHEVTNMTWQQVDFEHNIVSLKRGKGGKHSTHFMTPRLRKQLEERKAAYSEFNYVFHTMAKKPKKVAFFKRAVERAGISEESGSIVLHTLRHTYANRMLKANLQLPEVQQLLGHKNITTTMRYIHLHPTNTAQRALDAQLRNQDGK